MAIAEAEIARLPWYRDVTREQWRAFFAVFLGWVVDAFDYNVLAFVMIDIQKSFTVSATLAGALATVTLVMRLVGGVSAGSAADKYGRKLPMMVSILWFSLFAVLSGFSTSYAMLFGFRALFGIGMGGEWTSGMPLLLEHWPARHRGIASGLLLGGWYWGNLLAAMAFYFLYPLFQRMPDIGWRAMFWIAVVPAFLTLWIRKGVPESPVWLARQRRLKEAGSRGASAEPKVSLVRIFRPDLRWTTVHTTLLIGAFMCAYYSINQWYPTFLRLGGFPTLPFMVAFNFGAIGGTAVWGRLSETRLGRRGAATITAMTGIAFIPLYLHATNMPAMMTGAFMMGAFGCGIWGTAPAYVTERYPTSARGVGPGFCYHAAAAIGSVMPILIGKLQDRGMTVGNAMTIPIAASLSLCVILIWLGPETRGRVFTDEI